MRRLVSLLAPYKVHKPPKNLYLLTWAGNKMSYCYFLFIFSWYVKPKLISEKFEAIFVKHFIPWNLTASKRCSSQIGPETPQKILRGAFSMPKSNSKHTRNWWDSFLLFWLGANSLPRTCDLRKSLNKFMTLIWLMYNLLNLLPIIWWYVSILMTTEISYSL